MPEDDRWILQPMEDVYLGDGAYLHYDGQGYELRANSHDNPTDRVYLEDIVAKRLVSYIQATEKAKGAT
mgnify:CR=1 FL=1